MCRLTISFNNLFSLGKSPNSAAIVFLMYLELMKGGVRNCLRFKIKVQHI